MLDVVEDAGWAPHNSRVYVQAHSSFIYVCTRAPHNSFICVCMCVSSSQQPCVYVRELLTAAISMCAHVRTCVSS